MKLTKILQNIQTLSGINNFEFKIRGLFSGEVCVVHKKHPNDTLSFKDSILDKFHERSEK